MGRKKIIRVTTVASSLKILLKGQLSYMNQFYEIIGVASKHPMLDEVTEQEGIRTIGIEMTRQITPLKDLKAVWHLYRLFRKEKPEIVHTHTPKAGTLGLLAAYIAGVPNRLHTIAGLPLMEATGKKRTLLITVEKITYACANKIYPNSKGLDEFVKKQRFAKADKFLVIGDGSSNGINMDHFNPTLFTNEQKNTLRKELNIPHSERVLIYLGRIVNDKGIHELIDAFVNISSEFKNVTLIIGGDYERDLDPISPKAEKILNTHPKIKLLGWLKDVRPYLSMAEVMIFPSYREGFPNVVMQAGAMGIPVIASDINGCNEIIIDDVNGYIVLPKDSYQLQEKIKKYLDRENPFSLEVCRKLIMDRYDQKLIWQLLHKEYEQILS
jgi:glycosyltransferase involved in cell wall biosynthesis